MNKIISTALFLNLITTGVYAFNNNPMFKYTCKNISGNVFEYSVPQDVLRYIYSNKKGANHVYIEDEVNGHKVNFKLSSEKETGKLVLININSNVYQVRYYICEPLSKISL